MVKAYTEFWTKMFTFNATATRFQYWTATIVNAIIIFIYGVLTHQSQYFHDGTYEMGLSANSISFAIILLLVWIANFTIRARRLHDSDHTNWWLLIEVVPFIGQIWLIVLLLMPTSKESRWSPNQSNA